MKTKFYSTYIKRVESNPGIFQDVEKARPLLDELTELENDQELLTTLHFMIDLLECDNFLVKAYISWLLRCDKIEDFQAYLEELRTHHDPVKELENRLCNDEEFIGYLDYLDNLYGWRA